MVLQVLKRGLLDHLVSETVAESGRGLRNGVGKDQCRLWAPVTLMRARVVARYVQYL